MKLFLPVTKTTWLSTKFDNVFDIIYQNTKNSILYYKKSTNQEVVENKYFYQSLFEAGLNKIGDLTIE